VRVASVSFVFRGLPPGFPLCPFWNLLPIGGLRFSPVLPLFSGVARDCRLTEIRPVFLFLRGAPVFFFLPIISLVGESVKVFQDGSTIDQDASCRLPAAWCCA
jgi:hypothetical protein